MGLFKKKKVEQSQPEPQQAQEDPMEKMDPTIRPGGVFMVQLLMKEPCAMPSVERMVEVLSRHVGKVELFGEDSAEKGFAGFAALKHISKFSDGEGPVQLSIMGCEEFDAGRIDEMRRSQMWDVLADRDRILSECKYAVLANDMLGGGLETLERANLDMDYLEALLELYPTCEAVYSLNSGKLVLADTIRNGEAQGIDRYIRYIVNARFVNISGTNDHIVDTLGLSLLFVEDLQYHFHDMDPNWVVGHAYAMASYILTNDRPIKDGDTIDGITDGHFDQSIQWKCHFEGAMLKPERAVLDVYMNEYAVGSRQGK